MSALYHSEQPASIPDASGIYRITCTPTEKIYIGSAINLRNRWRQHRNELRRNNHSNKKMQNAWNKHGEEFFTFEVIELILPPFLLEREQYWFDKLKPFDEKGFNLYRVAGSPYGREVSQETRDKIGAANRGKPGPNRGKKASPETRKKISQAGLGRKTSDETKKKLSQAGLGRKFSPESIEKRMQARLGFKHTPETREKLRQMNLGKGKGKQISPEQREKLRQANLGKPMHPKTKAIFSAHNEARMKTLILTDPDGVEHVVTGIRPFGKEHNLHSGRLMDVAKGKQSQHKGWKARFPDEITDSLELHLPDM